MRKGKNLITEISRDLEKIYIDVCKSHGLKIHQGCKSYYGDLLDTGVQVEYMLAAYKVCYLYLIRYIKILRPNFYRMNSGHFISYYNKKWFWTGHDYFTSYLPIHMYQNWKKNIKRSKILD